MGGDAVHRGEDRLYDRDAAVVRNLERAGVPRSVAMQMTGHLAESVYRRYDIVSDADLSSATRQLNAAMSRYGQLGAIVMHASMVAS